MFESKMSRIVTAAILAVSLAAFVISQQDTIFEQTQRLMHYQERIGNLETDLVTANTEISSLKEENEQLQFINGMLRDSINVLERTVVGLKNMLTRAQKTITNLEKELAEKKSEIKTLRAQAAALSTKTDAASVAKKQEVEAAIAQKETNVEQITTLIKEEEKVADLSDNEIITAELKALRLAQIESVSKNTQVHYKKVECHLQRASKPLSRLDDDGTNWVFTSFEFDLLHPERERIFEEAFRLRIVDADTNEEVAFLESNPAYSGGGQRETKGFDFQWKQNPQQAVYINMQAKKGKNYNAKLYYLNDGEEFLLQQSVLPIVKDGKMQ